MPISQMMQAISSLLQTMKKISPTDILKFST